jgi:type I restriction enzyme S subunit
MAGEWRQMTLGEAIELKRGYDLPSRERRDGPFAIVSSSGVSGRHAEAKAKAPGVVIGRYGTLGEVHYITEDYWPLNTALYVRDFKGNDPRFFSYFLRSLDFTAYSDKAAVPGLNRNDLHTAQVLVPPVAEQRAIAHILGTLDDKIELNRRMSETLEAMARALFKSWFVDFDPVRTKAEGRDPGLPEHIANLFPARLVDSELGEIPEGWEVGTLPSAIDVNPPRSLRTGEVAPYLDMANMPTRGHAPDEVVDREFGSGMRFINGDTLVARITPCLENGKTAFVDFLEEGRVGWGSTEYIVMRPKPPLPEEFAYCLARGDEFREFAIQSMTGSSGRQRVPAESLDHFRLAIAPRAIAEEFGRRVRPLFSRTSAAVTESRTLATLRDALLPKLISGELRVKDAEKFTAGAI